MVKFKILFAFFISIFFCISVFTQPADSLSVDSPLVHSPLNILENTKYQYCSDTTIVNNVVVLSEKDFTNIWSDIISSTNSIFDNTSKTLTIFGIFISFIVVGFSVLLTLIQTREQNNQSKRFTELKESTLREIRENVQYEANILISSKFENEYRNQLYKWTLEHVKSVMGWGIYSREFMQSYDREKNLQLLNILKRKFGDEDEFSEEIKDLFDKSAIDNLIAYKIMSGDPETVVSGLMECTQHPNEIFLSVIRRIQLFYPDEADIQIHSREAINSIIRSIENTE